MTMKRYVHGSPPGSYLLQPLDIGTTRALQQQRSTGLGVGRMRARSHGRHARPTENKDRQLDCCARAPWTHQIHGARNVGWKAREGEHATAGSCHIEGSRPLACRARPRCGWCALGGVAALFDVNRGMRG